MTPLCSGDSGCCRRPSLRPWNHRRCGIMEGIAWLQRGGIPRVLSGLSPIWGPGEEFRFPTCEPPELVLAGCKPAAWAKGGCVEGFFPMPIG